MTSTVFGPRTQPSSRSFLMNSCCSGVGAESSARAGVTNATVTPNNTAGNHESVRTLDITASYISRSLSAAIARVYAGEVGSERRDVTPAQCNHVLLLHWPRRVTRSA